ncbi:hypothetical protein IFM62136_07270 [Aspergillus lentulus]|nr:hypothetical protein IFM62136_07270 [Aspergillus lentulus]
MSTSRNSPVSDGKWERFKEIIRSLWETHTLSEMMKIMADDPNFHATKSQFEKRLKHWGFRRYKTSDDWRKVATKVEKRRHNQKSSTVEYEGFPIPPETLRKEMSRHTTLTELGQATNVNVRNSNDPGNS